MSNELSIVVSGITQPEISIIPSAIEQRDNALETSHAIIAVYDDETQKSALDALAEHKRLRLEMEATRKMVKAPVIKLGKDIDKAADEFIQECICEETRLDSLVTRHQKKLRALKEEEERKIREELRQQQIEEEAKLAAVRKREREAAEAAAKAATEAEREKARELEEKAKADAARLALESEEREIERQMLAPVVPAEQIIGSDVWTFEVSDAALFARHYPEFVKVEVKKRDVQDAIKAGKFDKKLEPGSKPADTACQLDETTIRVAPGLIIKKEVKVRH